MDKLAGRERIMITAGTPEVSGHRAYGDGCHVATETTFNLGLGLGSGVREK